MPDQENLYDNGTPTGNEPIGEEMENPYLNDGPVAENERAEDDFSLMGRDDDEASVSEERFVNPKPQKYDLEDSAEEMFQGFRDINKYEDDVPFSEEEKDIYLNSAPQVDVQEKAEERLANSTPTGDEPVREGMENPYLNDGPVAEDERADDDFTLFGRDDDEASVSEERFVNPKPQKYDLDAREKDEDRLANSTPTGDEPAAEGMENPWNEEPEAKNEEVLIANKTPMGNEPAPKRVENPYRKNAPAVEAPLRSNRVNNAPFVETPMGSNHGKNAPFVETPMGSKNTKNMPIEEEPQVGSDWVNVERGSDILPDGNIYFVESPEQKQALAAKGMETIKETEKLNRKFSQRLNTMKTEISEIIANAKHYLDGLEEMKKEGHTNGKEYNAMHDALEELSKMDPRKVSFNDMMGKLDTVQKTSAVYEKTHDKWYKASKGYGQDRLNMSRNLQAMARNSCDMLGKLPVEFKEDSVVNLSDRLEISAQMIGEAKEEKKNSQRRKMQPEEIQELMKGPGTKNEVKKPLHKSRPQNEKQNSTGSFHK